MTELKSFVDSDPGWTVLEMRYSSSTARVKLLEIKLEKKG